MHTPWLSILIPVYGVEAYLAATLDSLLTQLLDGVEIVLINDASPDGCAAILADYAQRHPEVLHVLTQEQNAGISNTRNDLLAVARGEYLWFVDSDDLVSPGVVAAVRKIIDAHAPDLLSFDFRTFEDATGQARKARYEHVRSFVGPSGVLHQDRDALLRGFFTTGQFHPWSKVVRRAIWPAELRFPAGRIFEDMAVYARLLLKVQTHFHVPEVWMSYRQRAGSALSGMKAGHLGDWMAGLDGYAAEMKGHEWQASTEFAVSHYCARALLGTRRKARRLKKPIENEMPIWRRASPLTAAQLTRAYLRRGQFLRALQWAITSA